MSSAQLLSQQKVEPESSGQISDDDAPQPSFITPPAPALRPEEEQQTIQLVDGYRLELIAADPLIQDPIAITFDADGRLWVCEMRGFMPDIDGNGEDAPIGVISVLDDTDEDGLMDKSTVFLDGLVLPRGLCWTLDGMLVCENGNIWLCKDSDGDDRCDEKQVVCKYNPGNLEHSLNGLMPALDNWIYNAKEGIRLRRVAGKWVNTSFGARGQWGITQDNYGYLRYNVNASLIRGDLVPCYSAIAQSNNSLVDVALFDDQVVYPIRPTPGINRGYIDGFLRPDGSIVEANSNCGPVVYRGDNLPSELIGNIFIPEPAGNLIRRQILTERDAELKSKNAYQEKEFLASTDERFRPVNMFNSPDGTMYIVDMYRGVIQHGAFITPYLREQILSRELDKQINLGRIWRVVHTSTKVRKPVSLSKLSSVDLVPYLSDPNGWYRDMAQQNLVQRGDLSVVGLLERVVQNSDNHLGRLHALWTLEGLGRLDPEFLYETLSDTDPNVRASAVTMYQRYLSVETMVTTIIDDLEEIARDENELVRMQIVLTLGLVDSEAAERVIQPILKAAANDEKLLVGILSGFAGKEAEFLAARLVRETWTSPDPWRKKLLRQIAAVMWKQRNPVAVLRYCHLLNDISDENSWQTIALLEGIKDPPRRQRRRFPPAPGSTAPSASASPRRIPSSRQQRAPALKLGFAPAGLENLRQSPNEALAKAAEAFADKLRWPGKDGQPIAQKRKLSDEQQALYDLGKIEYSMLCAGCHHVSGYGLAAKGPRLLGSEWLDNEQRLVRLVLSGIQGPITIDGELYNGDNRLSMPGMSKTLDDKKIAGVLTYVRREFSDDASPVTVEAVSKLRELLNSRLDLWTEEELLDAAE